MSGLKDEEIALLVEQEPLWRVVDGCMVREWKFAGFGEAMRFVNRVAELAEAANHHPDIDIRYDRVRLALVSHDVGRLTGRDARMARTLSREFLG